MLHGQVPFEQLWAALDSYGQVWNKVRTVSKEPSLDKDADSFSFAVTSNSSRLKVILGCVLSEPIPIPSSDRTLPMLSAIEEGNEKQASGH